MSETEAYLAGGCELILHLISASVRNSTCTVRKRQHIFTNAVYKGAFVIAENWGFYFLLYTSVFYLKEWTHISVSEQTGFENFYAWNKENKRETREWKRLNTHVLFVFLAGCNCGDRLEGVRLVAMQNVWRFWSEKPKDRHHNVDVPFMERHFIDYRVTECVLTGAFWLSRWSVPCWTVTWDHLLHSKLPLFLPCANIGFTRGLWLPQRCWCKLQSSGILRHVDWLEWVDFT
jgi:hypothetical protein